MEVQEDVILKEYNFKKWNGKILTRVTYDLKKNQQELYPTLLANHDKGYVISSFGVQKILLVAQLMLVEMV